MLIEKDIQKLLGRLSHQEDIRVLVDGSDILVHFERDNLKLSLSTIVYNGGNYIPSSVRTCVSHKSPIPRSSTSTFLTINERDFQISLNYLNQSPNSLSYRHFKSLLEEFAFSAEIWRNHLDENDKNDLVYVRVK
jgi:hypothetical protein